MPPSRSSSSRRLVFACVQLASVLLLVALSGFPALRAAAPVALVKDINPNSHRIISYQIPTPAFLTPSGSRVFFLGYDLNNGYELWKSDGTAAGTKMVKDIRTSPDSSDPYELTNVGGTLFFAVGLGSSGLELWSLDSSVLADRLPFKRFVPLSRR